MEALKAVLREHGYHSSIGSADLEQILQLTGAEIREMIGWLRSQNTIPNKHYPIGSETGGTHKGYFWATRPEQLDATLGHLNSRRIVISQSFHGLRRAHQRLVRQAIRDGYVPGQAEMFR